MTNLTKKALSGLVFLTFMLGLLLFLPAATFRYGEAWAYLVVFFIASGSITF